MKDDSLVSGTEMPSSFENSEYKIRGNGMLGAGRIPKIAFLKIRLSFLNMGVLPMYMAVPMCAWCLWRPEEGIKSPGTELTDGCEPHMGAGSQTLVL